MSNLQAHTQQVNNFHLGIQFPHYNIAFMFMGIDSKVIFIVADVFALIRVQSSEQFSQMKESDSDNCTGLEYPT